MTSKIIALCTVISALIVILLSYRSPPTFQVSLFMIPLNYVIILLTKNSK